jgi:thiol:disulfide interchange protein
MYWFPNAFGKSSSLCSEDDMFEYGVRWKNFSPELVEDLRKNSIPFYLDVTASWCVTCKLNKLLVFSDEELKIKLQNKGFVFVRADWTSGDPQITLFLKKYGANYVPFNLVYHPKIGEKILPTLLSAQKVRLELSEILNED